MMSFHSLLTILFVALFLSCEASTSDKQLLRSSHSSSHKVSLIHGSGNYQSSPKFTNIKKESIVTNNNFNIVSPFGAERGMSLLKSMATAVRDEVLDCVDSLVYAESNEEVSFIQMFVSLDDL